MCSSFIVNNQIPLDVLQKDLNEETVKLFQEKMQIYHLFREQVLDSIDLKHLEERQDKEAKERSGGGNSPTSKEDAYFY